MSLHGQRFGKWTVIGDVQLVGGNKNLLCRCDCGKEKLVYMGSLKRGDTTRCRSCASKESGRTRHGHCRSDLPRSGEYVTWTHMVRRCTNADDQSFPEYGGRGIRVCERWMLFDNFLTDMGSRPSRGHSIDRIDVNGHYEPGNCRWAGRDVQNHNKRAKSNTGYLGIHWREARGHFEWRVARHGAEVSGVSYSLPSAIANRAAAERAMYGGSP